MRQWYGTIAQNVNVTLGNSRFHARPSEYQVPVSSWHPIPWFHHLEISLLTQHICPKELHLDVVWNMLTLLSLVNKTVDQSTHDQAECALAKAKCFPLWSLVSSGFLMAWWHSNPTCWSLRQTVECEALTPVKSHDLLSNGTMSLLPCKDCLISKGSSLSVETFWRPNLSQ